MKKILVVLSTLLFMLFLAECNKKTPSEPSAPARTATVTMTATPQNTGTVTVTGTITLTATDTMSFTHTPTITETATVTQTSTNTPVIKTEVQIPIGAGYGGFTGVTSGDCDNDGLKELLVGRSLNGGGARITVFTYNGSSVVEKGHFDVPEQMAYCVVGDFDGVTTTNEIAVGAHSGDSGGALRIFKYTVADGYTETNTIGLGTLRDTSNLAIGDADNDSKGDLVVSVCWYARYAFIPSNDFSGSINSPMGGDYHSAYVADVDNDGTKEVLFGVWGHGAVVYSFNRSTGYTYEWESGNLGFANTAIAGDADNDGLNEIVAVSGAGNCDCWPNGSTNIAVSYKYSGGSYASKTIFSGSTAYKPVIANLTADGKNEVFLMADQELAAFKFDGSDYQKIWGDPIPDAPNIWTFYTAQVSAGDPDNDGQQEVMYAYGTTLKIYGRQ